MTDNNITIMVRVEVKDGFVNEFIMETFHARDLAESMEPGCVRYDIIQDTTDKRRFTLLETYISEKAIEEHKETQHFINWRANVQEMMASPRTSTKCKYL